MTKLSVDQALLKAKFYVKRGEVEEAQKLYQMVLQAFPKNKRAQQGLVALNTPKQSIDVPGPPQEAINQLINLYNQGQMAAVIEQATPMTEQYPEAFMIWNILGAANKGLNRVADASKAFSKVTELNPNYADGFNNLGIILKEQGKLDEAIASYNKALSLKPDYAEGYYNMGNALKEYDKLGEAIEAYNKAIVIKPDYAEAYYNMGNALQDQGKLDEAIDALNKALILKPDQADAYYNIGNALQDQDKLDKAVEAYNKALAIKPDYAEAHNNLGYTFRQYGKLMEAIEAFNKALLIKPDYAEAHNNLGVAFQDHGELDEAIEAYNKALSIRPTYADAHRNISTLIRYTPPNPQISAVNALLGHSDLKDNDRCNLHYAFAKMNEDIGELNVAFKNYVAGGRLRQKLLAYDLEQDQNLFAKIKNSAHSLKNLEFDTPDKAAAHTPIFILGMPRSGTTLVEQIISCHSQVHGAGELPFLNVFGKSIATEVRSFKANTLAEFRKAYLGELAKVSNGKQFVIDKMPQNFQYIGLILSAFPNSKIVHVKRDPAATCWSNFKHYFSSTGLGYSYDIEDTVSYFKLYRDLMGFWDDLYGDQIYHVDYDRLTVQQKPETKNLIEHLELNWEDACLSPQENNRTVKTASQQQVREKVYTGSSQAWRKFEPYLAGVFETL